MIGHWSMSQKCSSENICSCREEFLQEIKLNTSQLHSALWPRFWKGRWSENYQLSAYMCVLRLPQRWVLYACVPLVEAWWYLALWWALSGHFGPCPAGPDHCFVPAWLDNFSFLYTSNMDWGWGSFVSVFLIFLHALSSFGVCILKQNARPHLLLQ